MSGDDFNCRESDNPGSPRYSVQPSLEANLDQITKIVEGRSSAVHTRKQRLTGSSFYDATLKQQKIQEETQAEEIQKQMMRIFGTSAQSGFGNRDKVMSEMDEVKND